MMKILINIIKEWFNCTDQYIAQVAVSPHTQPIQITPQEFDAKVQWFLIMLSLVALYFFIRFLMYGMRFFNSGQNDETRMVNDPNDKTRISISQLQNTTWMFNASKVSTYASFTVGTLILAAVFIFEQRLDSCDAAIFDITLGMFALSVLLYMVSLQFWLLALDVGGFSETRIKYRKRATGLQTIGWLVVQAASIFATLAVSTSIGVIFGFLSVFAFVYIYETKTKISFVDEAKNAKKNPFQNKLNINEIKLKEPTWIAELSKDNALRIMSWNIERGYDVERLAKYIKEKNPDIVCLQEVDWRNRRTGEKDVLQEIAEATGMYGYFAIEFFELEMSLRNKSPLWSRKKSLAGGGVHGNAILTKIKPERTYRIDLPIDDYDWSQFADKISLRERREGSRCAICAEIRINGSLWTICSAHLENNCGIAGREKQLKKIVAEIPRRSNAKTIIAGDFNTIDNWLSRLSRRTKKSESCGNCWYRPESKWWKDFLLPTIGMYDPFSHKDWTFKLGGRLYREKLDWILVTENCEVIDDPIIGGFNTSDHCPLTISVREKT